MWDDRVARASRRAVMTTGLLGSMVLALGGGVGAVFSAVARSAPRPWRARALVAADVVRPEPVLYETGDPRTDFFLVEYPQEALPAARKVYEGAVLSGMEAGVVALARRCPHLGEPVDWCRSSQWFECYLHGSQFNAVGEKKGGPARSGMNLFAVTPRPDGDLDVDALNGPHAIEGAPIGTDTTGQQAEGPHCVGGGE